MHINLSVTKKTIFILICIFLHFYTFRTSFSTLFIINLVFFMDFYQEFFQLLPWVPLKNDLDNGINYLQFYHMLCSNVLSRKGPFPQKVSKAKFPKPKCRLFHHIDFLRQFMEEHSQQFHRKFVFYWIKK